METSRKEKKKEKGKVQTQDFDAAPADLARDVRLRVQVTDAAAGRQAVEPLLEEITKTWQRAARAGSDGGGVSPTLLEYEVRLRKRYPADEVRARLLRDAQAVVVSVEVLPTSQGAAPTVANQPAGQASQ
jgi:hypothetical protein